MPSAVVVVVVVVGVAFDVVAPGLVCVGLSSLVVMSPLLLLNCLVIALLVVVSG